MDLGNFYTKTIDRNSYATAAELEDAVDRPQILFGKSEPFSYGIILSNNKGDTVYSGGISAIWGYCNGVDGSGTQVLLKFTGIFQWRSRNTPAAWSEWISPLSNTDLQAGRDSIQRTAGQTVTKQVTFQQSFSAAPAVTINAETSDAEGTRIHAGSVTSSGFTVYAYSNVNDSMAFDWIAIFS